MKSKLIIFIPIILFCSCSQRNTSNSKEAETQDVAISSIDKQEHNDIETLFEEFKMLYKELIEFKSKPDFIQLGFGAASPYVGWLNKVDNLIYRDSTNMLASQKKVLAGELKQLGYIYASTKGAENESSAFFNGIFESAISDKRNVDQDAFDYASIKNNYTLIGRWKLYLGKGSKGYLYEIYTDGNKCIGVYPENTYKPDRIEVLDKKGNKYFDENSKEGEYFTLDKDLNMSLFDNKGELTSMGCIAVKQ